jgi:hypothetical protein
MPLKGDAKEAQVAGALTELSSVPACPSNARFCPSASTDSVPDPVPAELVLALTLKNWLYDPPKRHDGGTVWGLVSGVVTLWAVSGIDHAQGLARLRKVLLRILVSAQASVLCPSYQQQGQKRVALFMYTRGLVVADAHRSDVGYVMPTPKSTLLDTFTGMTPWQSCLVHFTAGHQHTSAVTCYLLTAYAALSGTVSKLRWQGADLKEHRPGSVRF